MQVCCIANCQSLSLLTLDFFYLMHHLARKRTTVAREETIGPLSLLFQFEVEAEGIRSDCREVPGSGWRALSTRQ